MPTKRSARGAASLLRLFIVATGRISVVGPTFRSGAWPRGTPDLKVGPTVPAVRHLTRTIHETHSFSQHVLGWYYMGRHA